MAYSFGSDAGSPSADFSVSYTNASRTSCRANFQPHYVSKEMHTQ